MAHPVSGVDAAADVTADLIRLYRALYLPRAAEEKMLRLIRQGRISKWFSGYGQEAIAVGCAWALRDDDYVLPMHRNLGVFTTRGVDLRRLFCQVMGRDGGFTKGRDRTFHFGLPEQRIVGMISQLAAMLPVACGLGLASQLRRDDFAALAFVGEGSTRQGDFHEALNLASVWKLPVVFVVENNGYGLSTPTREVVPVENIADAAAGYGMNGMVVDGNDVLAVIETMAAALERARRGEGPTLVEAKTFRVRGHEEASGTWYVPDDLIEEWKEKDPIARFEKHLIEGGAATEAELQTIREQCAAEIDDAVAYAFSRPEPASDSETERSDVFAPSSPVSVQPSGRERSIRVIDAISEALHQALESDERVLIMGQDIAEYGGVFKATEGLVERFGKERVRNTPIIESGAVGAALGLALGGFKPVLEIQYADFIACGFNQIVNNLATTHYRWGAPVNVTIRAPFGGGIGVGPFHSQSMEAWFCHVPGLKVAVPSTPADAKQLLLASIDDPNPVLFLEHKLLYRSLRGSVDEAPVRGELGRARVARAGRDITIVTYGVGVVWAEEEAESLAGEGVEVEIIDLRTLVPLDLETVLTSIKKTNRLVVLHEAALTAGFGGEIAARVSEQAFAYLDAPPARVAALDTPVPSGQGIERDVYSARGRLREAIHRTLRY